jgi:hypothetical protein
VRVQVASRIVVLRCREVERSPHFVNGRTGTPVAAAETVIILIEFGGGYVVALGGGWTVPRLRGRWRGRVLEHELERDVEVVRCAWTSMMFVGDQYFLSSCMSDTFMAAEENTLVRSRRGEGDGRVATRFAVPRRPRLSRKVEVGQVPNSSKCCSACRSVPGSR